MDEPSCPGCRQRDAIIARLQQQLATLTERVRVLEEQLQNNASNSSLPPSANPPQTPKPVVKQPLRQKTRRPTRTSAHLATTPAARTLATGHPLCTGRLPTLRPEPASTNPPG